MTICSYNPGSRLRQIRREKNISQTEVARHLNVDQSTYSCWECGTRRFPFDRAIALAHFFEINPATFVLYLLDIGADNSLPSLKSPKLREAFAGLESH